MHLLLHYVVCSLLKTSYSNRLLLFILFTNHLMSFCSEFRLWSQRSPGWQSIDRICPADYNWIVVVAFPITHCSLKSPSCYCQKCCYCKQLSIYLWCYCLVTFLSIPCPPKILDDFIVLDFHMITDKQYHERQVFFGNKELEAEVWGLSFISLPHQMYHLCSCCIDLFLLVLRI